MPATIRHVSRLGLLVALAALGFTACDGGSTAVDAAAPDTAAPDAVPADAAPDADDAAPDPAVDAAPDIAVDAAPDVSLDAGPDLDAAPDAQRDMLPDTQPDMLPDAQRDMLPDAQPDMLPDMLPDAQPDMPPDAAPPPLEPPQITELAARDGAGLLDEDGDPSDWIELYNPNPVPYPLAGHHLTDTVGDDGWAFPDVSIPPGGYRVVFASDKDRAPLDGPLHTDFRLAADGEYLALLDPDGAVLDAWIRWPPQLEQASWGRPMTVERAPLVMGPAQATPLDMAQPGWSMPIYADGAWPRVDLPVGYDRSPPPAPDAEPGAQGPRVADSVADWSAAGVQGFAGWTYGYADRSAVDFAPYTAAHFVPFPRDGGGHSATDAWNGTSYDWFRGNPPWTLVGQRDIHPNGTNNGVEHWAIRRLEVATAGPHIVEWQLRKTNLNGRGVSGHLLQTRDGFTEVIDTAAIEGHDAIGVTRRLLVDLQPGDLLDLAVDPTGPDGDAHDGADNAASEMRLWSTARLDDLLATRRDWPAGTGVAVRVPFEVPPGADWLELAVLYADGFAAWIDGAPVAAANLPGGPGALVEPGPETRALSDRPPSAAVTPAHVIAGPAEPGARTLSIAAVDGPSDDGRLVLGVEAFAVSRQIEREGRYLAPTPGADNSPPADIGPVVFDLSRDVPVEPDTPVEISVRVAPTAAPIERVRLTWRVAFEPPQTMVLLPDADDAQRYGASLPSAISLPGQLVRWFVEATDSEGRTTREPPFPDALDSEEFVGTVVADPSIESDLPVLHWFIEQPGLADRPAGTRSTLWFDGELYDNVRVDLHGQSTRSFPKKSYDVDLNRDHRFRLRDDLRRMKDFNLLTNYADKSRVRNTLAYEALAMAGADHHLAFPIRIQRNRGFFAVADFVEDGDDRWIERLGYDPVGPLYKVYDGAFDANRGEKKTLKDEPNDDYRALIAGLSLPAAERRRFLYDNLDLARMANYLAGSFIHASVDCCHKNYYIYRDAVRHEWWMLTWDVDLSFGRRWTGTYFDDRLYPDLGLFIGRDIGGNNQLLRALYTDPAFVEMYLRRTRTLVDALLQPPETPPEALVLDGRVDAITAAIGEDAARDADIWPTWGEAMTMAEGARRLKEDFLALRRAWVYGTLVEHEPGVVLIPGDPGAASARYRVPLEDDPDLLWTTLDFNDADWDEGPLGLGYENSPADYDALIATPVRPPDVDPGATSIQLRVPFVVEDPATVEQLTFAMKYDDGFVAWINGVEIARRNVDGLPAWDAAAVNHPDNQAAAFESIPVPAAAGALVPGLNVLAIQVVNTNPGSSDLLAQPALVDGVLGQGVLPPAQPSDAVVFAAAMSDGAEPAEDWIRVVNPGPEAVDISDWIVRGAGIEHRFTPGTVVPAGGAIHVVAHSVRFRSRAESPTGGEGHFAQGDWRGRLVPAFGLPEIIRPDGSVIPPGGF